VKLKVNPKKAKVERRPGEISGVRFFKTQRSRADPHSEPDEERFMEKIRNLTNEPAQASWKIS